jgi:FdhD protein
LSSEKKIKLIRIDGGEGSEVSDSVAVEASLAIYVGGRELVTLLYTPPMALELALGYLLSEGLISDRGDVESLSLKKNGVLVELAGGAPHMDVPAARVLTSGCGGGITFTYPQGIKQIKKLSTSFSIPAQDIIELAAGFRKGSRLFEETGGVHSAALTDGSGFLAFADDIGRHNAVDKVFGKCFMGGIETRDRILLTTGRVSSEVLIKAAKRGVPVVVSRGAPTSLAVELAEKLGVTLVGFARGRRMNVYTHADRVRV